MLELPINDKATISELQAQFGKVFPYLKVEFFNIPFRSGMRFSKANMFPLEKNLGACRHVHHEGIIHITPYDTVEKLENTFWKDFGLAAKIFRKSGNLWIETSLSNSWTLQLQNEEGKTFSDGLYKMPREDEDVTDRDKWG
jgi:hypothetical protein